MSVQSLSVLASGLAAQSSVVARVADNIVNVNTAGYAAQTGALVSQSTGGVEDVSGRPSGEVDLATQIAGMQLAGSAYGAAAKTFAAVAKMDRAVLDLIA